MFCLCYYFLCVLYTLEYVWGHDPVISCLHIDFFMECRAHIYQPIHCTQNVGTFVEQISNFSCVPPGRSQTMISQYIVRHRQIKCNRRICILDDPLFNIIRINYQYHFFCSSIICLPLNAQHSRGQTGGHQKCKFAECIFTCWCLLCHFILDVISLWIILSMSPPFGKQVQLYNILFGLTSDLLIYWFFTYIHCMCLAQMIFGRHLVTVKKELKLIVMQLYLQFHLNH